MNCAPDIPSPLSFLASGGEMARRIREFDWSAHPLGPPEGWPQSLKVVVRILLTSRFAMWMGWGPEFYFFCNDAYAPTLGIKRDWVLGASARKVWAEIWSDIGPRAESVVRTGEATWDESLLLFLERSGYAEETYHTFSYSPVPHDDGSIGGMLCVVTEETERVIGARRLALLRELGADLASINTEQELFRAIGARLGERSEDLPFALIYLLAADGKSAQLACAHHATDAALAPPEIALGGGHETWPATLLFERGAVVPVDDLAARFSKLPRAPWDEPPRRAVLVPVAHQGQERPAGFLVAGLNPYRPFDAAYAGFLDLLAGQIAAGLASARAYEAERKRAEALAEIDRAKTAFFSNVSHEFRTPLTLLLSLLEEIVNKPAGEVFEDNRQLATLAHRNGLRLLKLVNSLLDFSRIEAGRTRAHFEPVDLAACTAELASSFRSAMEKAGLEFTVERPPLPEPFHVDRELWEKIVLNLLSNAFKFTLRGGVEVKLRCADGAAELTVRDTGTGIPREAQPHLFERFYRVQGAQGRTHEGSGIGLALVHELVKLHGGTVRVESEPGVGSAFVVTIPRGTAHLPAAQCAAPPAAARGGAATAFVAEALRWLPDETDRNQGTDEGDLSIGLIDPLRPKPRVLLADDNADMREYIARLLAPHCEVVAVADGHAALEAALDERPDLVLTDVMMPQLDGFGLLRAMRADATLQTVPIILLSARAGEEARVEGLEAGADDYLTKPFQTRELLAKVNGTLALAKARAEAMARETELRAERTEILENMNVAFMAMDEDFRIVYLNPEAGRLHGLTPEKYLGRIHWEAFPAANGTPVETNYRRAMTERVPVRFENFYAPWQQWFEINAYPMSGGRLGVFFREITERKRAEEALRASAGQLRLIADTAPVLIAHCDREHRYKFVNEPYAARFGLRREQVIGRRIAEVVGEAAYASIRPHVERVLAGEGVEVEIAIPYEKLGTHWMRCAYAPERAANGEVVGLVAVIIDITERKQMEMQLRESKETAESANASKDRFLAILSHELRTPLTPVLMAVAALEQDSELPPEVREDMAMIKRNVELETKLIDDLLDLSRITSGKLKLEIEPVDLNEAVRRVCAICRSTVHERGIRLETSLDDAAGLVAADPARLQQMLWNVLKNAIKFTPEAGTIRISTHRLDGPRGEVRVQDSGRGIPAEVLPRVFNAFEQGGPSVTRQFGGLGLGLAICKALAELHHGSIRAESAGLDQGSTFIIELPGETPAALLKTADAPPAENGKPRALRLLVVEDHADTARTLNRLLRRAGFAVVSAADAASATAFAEREPFDLLISDLGLPDGNGYEIMRHVRAKRGVPGIAMSGYGMDEDVRRSREAGFVEHLVKPINGPQLIAAIQRATEGRS